VIGKKFLSSTSSYWLGMKGTAGRPGRNERLRKRTPRADYRKKEEVKTEKVALGRGQKERVTDKSRLGDGIGKIDLYPSWGGRGRGRGVKTKNEVAGEFLKRGGKPKSVFW